MFQKFVIGLTASEYGGSVSFTIGSYLISLLMDRSPFGKSAFIRNGNSSYGLQNYSSFMICTLFTSGFHILQLQPTKLVFHKKYHASQLVLVMTRSSVDETNHKLSHDGC